MAQVICDEVGQGLRPSERTVAIKDITGRRHYIRVEHDFLTHGKDDKLYLPMGTIYVDPRSKAVLLEFPHAPDSDSNRVWVQPDALLDPVEGCL